MIVAKMIQGADQDVSLPVQELCGAVFWAGEELAQVSRQTFDLFQEQYNAESILLISPQVPVE